MIQNQTWIKDAELSVVICLTDMFAHTVFDEDMEVVRTRDVIDSRAPTRKTRCPTITPCKWNGLSQQVSRTPYYELLAELEIRRNQALYGQLAHLDKG